jgi:hypothetical protein
VSDLSEYKKGDKVRLISMGSEIYIDWERHMGEVCVIIELNDYGYRVEWANGYTSSKLQDDNLELVYRKNSNQKSLKFNIFKRRKRMNPTISKLFPKTKEYFKVEDQLNEHFDNPLFAIVLEGKQKQILELAESIKAEKEEKE